MDDTCVVGIVFPLIADTVPGISLHNVLFGLVKPLMFCYYGI